MTLTLNPMTVQLIPNTTIRYANPRSLTEVIPLTGLPQTNKPNKE